MVLQVAANRMSALIKDLLAFSRITTQREAFEPVPLAEVVRDVLTDLELAIQEAGAITEIGPLPIVQGDRPQLGQLFQNLISNAVKFRRLDRADPASVPHIRIDCQRLPAAELPNGVKPARPAEQFYQIRVVDNGIGFDEKYLDRIFEVFQRLHGRSQYAGTGIGLAIVQKVAENHGGAITATSQPGQGATFWVYLPA